MKTLSFKILLTIFAILFLFCQPLRAQNTEEYNRAYNDYLFSYDQYRRAYDKYVVAKQSYLSYKTLTSKTEAFNETLKMLQARDEVLRTYLTTLRLKLAQATAITNYQQNVLYLNLDSEIIFYNKHQTELTSAGTLEDLLTLSANAEKNYQQTEALIYKTLAEINSSKEVSLQNRINKEIKEIKDKINLIRQNGDKDTTKAERWLLEAENRLTRSQEKIQDCQQLLTKIKSFDKDKIKLYNQASFVLSESHQYLKEANSYLKELVVELKNAD